MRAIVASHAAKGLLASGATIRAAVRATSEVTHDAVSKALSGIERVTEHAGNKRKVMLVELTDALAAHHEAIEARAGAALTKIGLGNDVRHAARLFALERARHVELITGFREGWTAPAGKPWHQRRPILAGTLLAVIAFAIGWAGQSLIGDQWVRPEKPAVVAPDVAPSSPKPSRLPQNSS